MEVDFAEGDDIDGFTIVAGGIGARTEVEATFQQVEPLAVGAPPGDAARPEPWSARSGRSRARRTRG